MCNNDSTATAGEITRLGPTIKDTWRGIHPSADVLCATCGERFDKHRQQPYCNCPKTKHPLRDGEWPYRVEAFVPALARDVTDEVAALRAELEKFADEAERDAAEMLALRTERDSYAFEMRNERARADITEAEVERMRAVVDDYLRQAKNHERHREAGGFLNMAEDTMVRTARAFRAAQQESITKESTND